MNDWLVEFRSPSEAEAAHPHLKRDIAVSIADLDQLKVTGRYRYMRSDFVTCQLERDGRVCTKEHGRGFIVRRPDGDEGYVGWCCNRNHLKSSEHFQGEIQRLDRALKAANRRRRIAAFLADSNRIARAETLAASHGDAEAKLKRVRAALPSDVLRRLDEIRRAISNEIVIHYRYEIPDEDKTKVEWRRSVVGRLRGLRALDRVQQANTAGAVGAISSALNEARTTQEPATRAEKRWLKSFDGLAQAEREVERLHSDLAEFLAPENLHLLLFVGHYLGSVARVIAAIQPLLGKPEISQLNAERAAAQWAAGVRQANEGREFRSY